MASKPSCPTSLQDLVTCSICLEDFTDPRTLPCLHSYCKDCLQRLVTPPGKITCPQCRMDVEIPDGDASKLSANFVMNSLVEVVSLTNDVTTTSDTETAPCCSSHSERECELYCQDCSKLICYQCIAKWGSCHAHLYQDVKETDKEFRKTVEEFSQRGEQFLPTIKQHLGLLEDLKANQVANVAEVWERIQDTFNAHIESLKKRKDELVKTLFESQRQHREGLHAEVDRVQIEEAKIANVLDFCSKMLKVNNAAMFIQKYSDVKDKVFGLEFPELVSHVEICDMQFKANDSLLRDVISNYGAVVKFDKDKPEERKAQETQNDEKAKTLVENSGMMWQTRSQPQYARVERRRATSGNDAGEGSNISTGGPSQAVQVREARSAESRIGTRNTSNQPFLWKLSQNNCQDFVYIGDKGLSVQSPRSIAASVIGIPGFRSGQHSWKVKLENLGNGVGVGVCFGKYLPGICLMLETPLSRRTVSGMVTVTVDCEAKQVNVKLDGHPSNTIGFQNQLRNVHPYFLLLPGNGQGKLSIVEMDGKSVTDGDSCCLL